MVSDVNAFDSFYGLPAFNLNVTGTGGTPVANWDLETALDVEWAHAMAPGANITLMRAPSASDTDIFLCRRCSGQLASPASDNILKFWRARDLLVPQHLLKGTIIRNPGIRRDG